jgi:hypothetical protein
MPDRDKDEDKDKVQGRGGIEEMIQEGYLFIISWGRQTLSPYFSCPPETNRHGVIPLVSCKIFLVHCCVLVAFRSFRPMQLRHSTALVLVN